jgi:hypothetical protein
MYSCTNVTTKQELQEAIDWQGLQIEKTEPPFPLYRSWHVKNKFGSEWTINFVNEVGEFTVSGLNGEPFTLYLYLSGNKMEIHKAVDSRGRTIQSERLLRKYRHIACMVSSYFIHGYLNI